MAVLDCYHVYPVREIPGWLKKVQICMSCLMPRSYRSHKIDVLPYSDDTPGKEAIEHEEKVAKKTHPDDKDADSESSRSEAFISGIDVITMKTQANEEDEKRRFEWKKLAMLFDRLNLIIFGVIHFIMILVIFLILPYA